MLRALKLHRCLGRLRHKDGTVREAALRGLADLQDPRAVEPLTAILSDGDSRMQALAAAALGNLGDPRAFDPLVKAVSASWPDVCIAAAGALGRLGDARAVEPLTQALADGRERVRAAAADALRCLAHPEWRQWIRGGREDYVRIAKSGHPRAFDVLRLALAKGSTVAAAALGELGDPRAVEPLLSVFGDTSANVDRNMRLAATAALGRLGDRRAVEPLIRALGDRRLSADLRMAAAVSLASLGDAHALEPLADAYNNQSGDIRIVAAASLGRLGDDRGVETLVRALGDHRAARRRAVAEWLDGIGRPEWKQWVKGDDADFARLGASGDARAFEPLLTALGEGGDGCRPAAADALGRLEDARAVQPLLDALGEADGRLRAAAANALAMLGQAEWKQWVQGDEGDFERLGASREPRAEQPLMKTLRDREHGLSTRIAAARALGRLEAKGSVDLLIKILKDRSTLPDAAFLCPAAAEALGRLADKRAIRPLMTAQRLTAPAFSLLRETATQALEKIEDAYPLELMVERVVASLAPSDVSRKTIASWIRAKDPQAVRVLKDELAVLTKRATEETELHERIGDVTGVLRWLG